MLHLHPKSKQIQISDETRQYLEKKLSKLYKHFHREPDVQFAQGFERGQHIVEVTLNGDGVLLRSQMRNSALRAAIDGVVEKLESQWKRFKEKRVTTHRQASAIKTEAEAALEGDGLAALNIVRRKTFPMQSMPPEEAARQMELLGHSFFVFRNEETNRVGVLYRRQDGDYGLIEPEA